MYRLNFSIPLLPLKWRSKIGVRQRAIKCPSGFPVWENVSTRSFHSPNEPGPLCTPAAEAFLVTSEVLHTYAHYVWGRQPGLRPFGGAKALLVCDLDLISPYTVFIRFLIWISGRVHCFENNKFRLIFKAAIFSFINSIVYKYKYTLGLLSSTWM